MGGGHHGVSGQEEFWISVSDPFHSLWSHQELMRCCCFRSSQSRNQGTPASSSSLGPGFPDLSKLTPQQLEYVQNVRHQHFWSPRMGLIGLLECQLNRQQMMSAKREEEELYRKLDANPWDVDVSCLA